MKSLRIFLTGAMLIATLANADLSFQLFNHINANTGIDNETNTTESIFPTTTEIKAYTDQLIKTGGDNIKQHINQYAVPYEETKAKIYFNSFKQVGNNITQRVKNAIYGTPVTTVTITNVKIDEQLIQKTSEQVENILTTSTTLKNDGFPTKILNCLGSNKKAIAICVGLTAVVGAIAYYRYNQKKNRQTYSNGR